MRADGDSSAQSVVKKNETFTIYILAVISTTWTFAWTLTLPFRIISILSHSYSPTCHSNVLSRKSAFNPE